MTSGIVTYNSSLRIRGIGAIKSSMYEFVRYEKIIGSEEPWAATGNFAVTFRVVQIAGKGGSKEIGIRVWHVPVKDDDLSRYRSLSPILRTLNQESDSSIRFTPTELLEPPEEGFEIKEGLKPALRMDWVNGVNFDDYVRGLITSRELKMHQKKMALKQLKFMMMELLRFMHRKGVSHGDISSGNVMVEELSAGGTIRLHLVDFDSFYAPEIKDLATISPGHPDWQHPRYINGELDLFGLRADYCPFLLMAITLEALSLDTNFYTRYSSKATDGSGILIRKNDLTDHLSSAVLNEMRLIADEELAMHINDLDILLGADSVEEIEFPTSLEDQYEVPADIVTRVNRVSIGGRLQRPTRKRRLRETFHRPDDVEKFLDVHQPTVKEVQNNLHFNRDNRANLGRIEGGLMESYRLCIEHFGGVESADPIIVVPYAWALFNNGNTAEAKIIAEHVHSVSPSNADNAQLLCVYIYGDRKGGEKEWERVIEIANDVLDKSPSAVLISCAKAKAEKKLGLHESYRGAYEETLIRTQRHWKTLNSIVFDASRDNEFDVAVEAFFELLTYDADRITKLTGNMITNLLNPGLYSLRRCAIDGNDTAELLSTINPEILKLETSHPNQRQIKYISDSLNDISRNRFNPQTTWINLGMNTQSDLVDTLSALATLGIGEPIKGLDEAVQYVLSRAGARTPEGRSLHLSFIEDDPLCFNRDGNWITYLGRTQLRGPPNGVNVSN